MLSEYIKESKAFGSKEDNPMIYTLVIAKLVTSDKDTAKKDEVLFKLINKVEKILPKIDCSELKKQYSPISMFSLFETDTTKKALKDYVVNYYNSFEQAVAGAEKSFEDAYEIHQMFKDLMNCEEFQDFLKSL